MKKSKKLRMGSILIAALLIYFSYITIEQEKILKNKQKELVQVQADIEEEKKMQLKQEEQLKTLSTEEYVEKAARQKLGLVKEGERIFVDINK